MFSPMGETSDTLVVVAYGYNPNILESYLTLCLSHDVIGKNGADRYQVQPP